MTLGAVVLTSKDASNAVTSRIAAAALALMQAAKHQRALPSIVMTQPIDPAVAIKELRRRLESWKGDGPWKAPEVLQIPRQREPRPDMTGTLESFHVPDAMGWDLQIGNKIAPSR